MDTHDQWLTIREAAQLLNISELTVRRRIKDGKVAHRLEHGKYLINLSRPVTSTPEPVPTETDPEERAGRHLAPLADVRALLPDIAQLAREAGRASALEEQLRELERRCKTLEDNTLSLSNRNGWLESKLDEREREVKLLTDSQHRPPWWKRLFGTGVEPS